MIGNQTIARLCRSLLFRAAVLALLTLGAAAGESRTWVDVRGNRVVAEATAVTDTHVILRRESDRVEVLMPLVSLSRTDRDWLTLWRKDVSKAGGDDAVAASFAKRWPDRVAVSRAVKVVDEGVSERDGRKFYLYRSDNFRFTCDVQLTRQLVAKLARIFEGTHAVCEALPLGLRPHQQSMQRRTRYPILLFSKLPEYYAAGGLLGSAGTFDPKKDVCLVPLDMLGVRAVGSKYQHDPNGEHSTLVHEITHQLTGRALVANPWFREGLAEYVAVIPIETLNFDLRKMERKISDYLVRVPSRGQTGRGLQRYLTLPSLRQMLAMDQKTFMGGGQHGADVANQNYAAALMWFCYFAHDEGGRDGAAIKRYLQEVMKSGDGPVAQKALTGSKSLDFHQKRFVLAWKRRGIDVVFEKD